MLTEWRDFIDKVEKLFQELHHHLQWSLQLTALVQVFFNARADIKVTGISFINKDEGSIGEYVAVDILASYMWCHLILDNSIEIIFLST